MFKQSIVLILISMHLFGASPMSDDAASNIIGPHHAVLVREGKDAFIDKVCSTWLEDQVHPEELLDVMQNKARKQARDLGFEDHWFVQDMTVCVQEIVNKKEEHIALSILVEFMEYMTLSRVETSEPEIIASFLKHRQFIFGDDQDHFWGLLEENMCPAITLQKDVHKQQEVVMRFVPYGELPMAEFLALYSQGFVPMPLIDFSNMHTLEIKRMRHSLFKTWLHFEHVRFQRGSLHTFYERTKVGLERAWSDIMSAQDEEDRRLRVFMHYQLQYEGILEKLILYRDIIFGPGPEYGHYISGFQQRGVLDQDDSVAQQQLKTMAINLAQEVLS